MNFELNAAFSLSIAVSAVIGWIRYKKIDRSFLPFLVLTWVGLGAEVISTVQVTLHDSNAVMYNVYSLAEALLILWQFRRWGLFARHTYLAQALTLLYLSGWCYESFILSTITIINSYFIIGYSFIVVVMSILVISEMVFYEDDRLVRNSKFLICMGFILYFVYAILVEAFWIFGLNHTKSFRVQIYSILAYINLFTNLVFALALLWMPMRLRYILQY